MDLLLALGKTRKRPKATSSRWHQVWWGAIFGIGALSVLARICVAEESLGDTYVSKQPIGTDAQIYFNIPAQPLVDALEAFGAATGLGVFYEAELATGKMSSPLKGMFSPLSGLEELLQGTGYQPRTAIPGSISISPALHRSAPLPSLPSYVAPSPFASFFATIQNRLEHALCQIESGGSAANPIVIKLWVSSAGTITKTEFIDSKGNPVEDSPFPQKLHGLRIANSLPLGLSQPIIMVMFPPREGEATSCSQSSGTP